MDDSSSFLCTLAYNPPPLHTHISDSRLYHAQRTLPSATWDSSGLSLLYRSSVVALLFFCIHFQLECENPCYIDGCTPAGSFAGPECFPLRESSGTDDVQTRAISCENRFL